MNHPYLQSSPSPWTFWLSKIVPVNENWVFVLYTFLIFAFLTFLCNKSLKLCFFGFVIFLLMLFYYCMPYPFLKNILQNIKFKPLSWNYLLPDWVLHFALCLPWSSAMGLFRVMDLLCVQCLQASPGLHVLAWSSSKPSWGSLPVHIPPWEMLVEILIICGTTTFTKCCFWRVRLVL